MKNSPIRPAVVMAGLVPAMHVVPHRAQTWMTGTSPVMTEEVSDAGGAAQTCAITGESAPSRLAETLRR
jgi:hypothetical protein